MRGAHAACEALMPHDGPQGHSRDPTLISRRFRNSKRLAAPQMVGAHDELVTSRDFARFPDPQLRHPPNADFASISQLQTSRSAPNETRSRRMRVTRHTLAAHAAHSQLTPHDAPQRQSRDPTLILRRFRNSKRLNAAKMRDAHAA